MTDKRRFEGEWVKLGDVCEIVNGYAFKSKNYVSEGIRIIRIANVQKGYLEDSNPCYYPLSSNEDIERFALEKNDLLLSLTGNVGRVALLPDNMLPAALNQRVACLRVKVAEDFDKNYLFHILNSSKFEQDCISSAKGLAQKNLSTNWVKEYAIPCPPIEVQREISCLIRKVSSMIEESNSLLLRLDDLVKSRFIEMFGDPITNDKHFPQKRLSDIATIKGGYAFKSSRYAAHGIRIIRISNVQDGFIEDKFPAFYSESSFCGLENYLLDENDLLMSLTGNVGRVGMLPRNMLPAALNQRVACIKSKDEALCLNRFLFELFRYPGFIGNAERNASGMAQKNMSTKWLQAFNVMLPPLALQQEFADFVTQVDKLRFDVQQQIEKLETLKQSLMQEYFG